MNIAFNALKITNDTDLMYSILNKKYEDTALKPITFGSLGRSTEQFQFFVTATLSSSLSAASSASLQSKFLLNKLITLTSQSKYDVIESVMEKI